MKATLEYNLDDPDDSMSFDRAAKSLNLALALWEFRSVLRSKLKYQSDTMSDDTYKELENLQEEFFDILNNNGVQLDSLVQ